MTRPHLLCHVIHRLDHGGLEHGLVKLVNGLPGDEFRHVIVTLAGAGALRDALPPGVQVIDCPKRPGQDPGLQWQLWRVLRELRPDIVHTRNLATLELQLAARLAGVPVRLHGEHGHDMHDPDHRRARFRWLRQALAPGITGWTAVSQALARYLVEDVGVSAARVTRLCNGVDCARFQPRPARPRRALPDLPARLADAFLIGSVARLQPVKDPLNLVRAFVALLGERPAWRGRLGLVLVGEGPLLGPAVALLSAAGLADRAWLPGARSDIPALLQALDVFVLPSLAEGIPNTVLEAMASGLPVVATRVGGTPELVEDGATGRLVPRAEPLALAAALAAYAEAPELARHHGAAGRARAVGHFSLARMVDGYAALYRGVLPAT